MDTALGLHQLLIGSTLMLDIICRLLMCREVVLQQLFSHTCHLGLSTGLEGAAGQQ